MPRQACEKPTTERISSRASLADMKKSCGTYATGELYRCQARKLSRVLIQRASHNRILMLDFSATVQSPSKTLYYWQLMGDTKRHDKGNSEEHWSQTVILN